MSDSPETIEPAEVQRLVASGEAVLLDVREAAAFGEGHPEGAQNVPISELAFAVEDLPAGATVITSCGGGTRGPKAAAQLQELGIDARVMRGGLRGWRTAGLPVAE